MAVAADVDSGPRLLFTEPWEPIVVRRGDALGLRALADQFADALAPDLSNRVRDGRWVTILAWCLARSQEVFHAGGGRSVGTRAEQRQRYDWLRPLELMWVARTIIILAEDTKGRQLAGVRSVKRWLEGDQRPADRFGMTVDQFRAYRQTGMWLDFPTNGGHPVKSVQSPWEVQQWRERDVPTPRSSRQRPSSS